MSTAIRRSRPSELSGRHVALFLVLLLCLFSWQGLSFLSTSSNEFTEVSQEPLPQIDQHPAALLAEKIYFTNAFCDQKKRCTVGGVAKRGDAFKQIVKESCFRDGEGNIITSNFQRFHWFHQKVFRDRSMDNFVSHFSTRSPLVEEVVLNCDEHKGVYPVVWRKTELSDKIVLLVSQYYTEISLEWVEVWLSHYISIGVDTIVLYTGFEEDSKYSRDLDKMLDNYKDSAIRLNWRKVAELDIWAKAQVSMISHGCLSFKGSVILGADLDEIILPMSGLDLKSISADYTASHESWYTHFRQHEVDLKQSTFIKEFKQRDKNTTFDFANTLNTATLCDHRSPFHCRAKYMFRSVDVETCSTHHIELDKGRELSLNEPWMDTNKAVMLHLRGIQQQLRQKR